MCPRPWFAALAIACTGDGTKDEHTATDDSERLHTATDPGHTGGHTATVPDHSAHTAGHTGGPTGDYGFNFTGSGYAPLDGVVISYALADLAAPTVAVARTSVLQDPRSSGYVNVSWSDVLVTGHTYVFSWYADVDGDGACDASGADEVWSHQPIGPVYTDWGHSADYGTLTEDPLGCGLLDPP
jgi:hypothetical protein